MLKDMTMADIKDILNSQLSLGLAFAGMICFVVLPLNKNITSMVNEFRELNKNVEKLTVTVNNHEQILRNLSADVTNLNEEIKEIK